MRIKLVPDAGEGDTLELSVPVNEVVSWLEGIQGEITERLTRWNKFIEHIRVGEMSNKTAEEWGKNEGQDIPL